MNKIGEFFENAANKFHEIAVSHLQPDEEIQTYTTAMWKKSLIVSMIPIVGDTKKKYLLVLTDKNLYLIRVKLLRIKEISTEVIPLNEITGVVARSGMFDKLSFVTLQGKKYSFTDIEVEEFAEGLKEEVESE